MRDNIKTISLRDIHIIKPLWEGLNAQHCTGSDGFKTHYAAQTFEMRCKKILSLAEDCVHIDVLISDAGEPKGYCVCTVDGTTGELDSLYLLPEYRGKSFGQQLAQRGISWMRSKGCTDIIVTVADGNEHVFPFYEKQGFKVRKTVLQIPKSVPEDV